MTDVLSDEEAKELYAHYGLAYYCSSVLEHGVANALVTLELMDGRGGAKTRKQWETLVDDHYDKSFEKTLGALIKQLLKHETRSPDFGPLMVKLAECLKERNFLAHHFWREYAGHWYSTSGRQAMITRLEAARDLFNESDHALGLIIEPINEQHGITPDRVQEELDRLKG